MIARRLVVSGKVQRVFYRDWTVATAQGLGLAGWVRNRREGTVEILAEGPEERVALLAELCREGPPAAEVTGVAVEDVAPEGLRGFERRATA